MSRMITPREVSILAFLAQKSYEQPVNLDEFELSVPAKELAEKILDVGTILTSSGKCRFIYKRVDKNKVKLMVRDKYGNFISERFLRVIPK